MSSDTRPVTPAGWAGEPRDADLRRPAEGVRPAATANGVDAGVFAEAFAEHAPSVLRVLRRLGVGPGDLDDVCQDVFLVVYQRWGEFRGDSTLRTWICGIAVRKAIAHRRLKRVATSVALSEPRHLPADAPGQIEHVARVEARALLADALAMLADAPREVFVLYELEQHSIQEIAALQGVPLHTAYSRLYAARQQLATVIAQLAAPGGSR